MANRNVDSNLWRDPKVQGDFTPEDKLFWMYCLTSPYGNLSGVYEISYKQLSDDLGYSVETVKNLIYRFTTLHRLISYNAQTMELFIHNWYKYNWTKSPKFESALMNFVSRIKDLELKENVLEMYKNYKENDTVSIPYRYGSISISNTIPNIFNYEEGFKKEETKKPRKKREVKKFVPPTLDEVVAYAAERGSKFDPKGFYDFFTVSKWIDSKGDPVLNWKQKMISWEMRGKEKDTSNGTQSGTTKAYIPRRNRRAS
jgi:hypothetical protein